MTVFFVVLAVGGVAGWYLLRNNAASRSFELVLKKTDKAVATKSWSGQSIADEGAPIAPGTTMSTRNSTRTVFRYGPSASMRAAAQTELTLAESSSGMQGSERKSFATLDLIKGRLWLVSSPDVQWIVRTPVAIVRPSGKITEVDLQENGTCNVVVWQGGAEMALVKHPDKSVLIGDQQEASFSSEGTLVNPHPLTLSKDDSWLAWNLLETMGKEINEKPVSPAPRAGQK